MKPNAALTPSRLGKTKMGPRSVMPRRTPLKIGLVALLTASALPLDGASSIVFLLACAVTLVCVFEWRAFKLPAVVVLLLSWLLLSAFWSADRSATLEAVALSGALLVAGFAAGRLAGARFLLNAVVAAGDVLLALSAVTFFVLPNVGRTAEASHAGALKGVFIDRNTAAFVFVVMLSAYLCHKQSPLARVCRVIAVCVAIVATESGTGHAFIIIVFVIFYLLPRGSRRPLNQRKVAMFVGMSVLLSAVAFVMSHLDVVAPLLGRDSTLTGRTVIWASVDSVIGEQPYVGFGWGALWHAGVPVTEQLWAVGGFRFYHAHQAYLDVLLQVGLIGLVLLLSVFLGAMWRQLSRQDAMNHPGHRFAMLTIVTLALYGLVEQAFMSSFGFCVLSLVLSISWLRISPSLAQKVHG
ncbi:O-antigen ligase [Klenkia soli]|uniref:O-antigen ligase n=1 Tax=Klenkia soli TaxID=1052260 RepID=A0A1H0NWI0_9ACTN|nr:O-antigen ligase family protein [Klenkia soli]SDO97137.1 O-antigen ligase [Klenkia soli]